jgi:hypothetical protein
MLKVGLAGLLLSQDSFKTSWEVVVRTINKDEFVSTMSAGQMRLDQWQPH